MRSHRAKKAARQPTHKSPVRRPRKEMQPRQSWVFVDARMNEDREERQVRALEFIAHYLDRIELQLERVADAMELVTLEESTLASPSGS